MFLKLFHFKFPHVFYSSKGIVRKKYTTINRAHSGVASSEKTDELGKSKISEKRDSLEESSVKIETSKSDEESSDSSSNNKSDLNKNDVVVGDAVPEIDINDIEQTTKISNLENDLAVAKNSSSVENKKR